MLDAFFLLRACRDAAGVVVDFEIVEANRAGAALIGTDLDDVIGSNLCELLPVARSSGALDIYRRVMESGVRHDGEYRTHDPRSTAEWLRLQATAMPDGVAVTLRDITERKRTEATTS
jgi:PAS domain S-box-containing protein